MSEYDKKVAILSDEISNLNNQINQRMTRENKLIEQIAFLYKELNGEISRGSGDLGILNRFNEISTEEDLIDKITFLNEKIKKRKHLENSSNNKRITLLEKDKKLLNEEVKNLKNIIKNIESKDSKKFSNLQKDYDNLLDKYKSIQKELDKTKINEDYYEDLSNRLKEFIINSY
jgi:hypothetical protein